MEERTSAREPANPASDRAGEAVPAHDNPTLPPTISRRHIIPAWPSSIAVPRLPSRETRHRVLAAARSGLRIAAIVFAGLAVLVVLLTIAYRWINPPASTLMLAQRLTGTAITQRWVPLERISPNLQHAVIMSEDGAFCRHWGVDWGEIAAALGSARDGVARGGSTISMQVVKNLYLWPSKSYVRKALEIPLTYLIELMWSKPRILEIYLNIAEWGPGVFGADAAARHHFGKPAALLTPQEAALLAVALPNPIDRQAGIPGRGTVRLANNLMLRMRAAQGNSSCVRVRPSRW